MQYSHNKVNLALFIVIVICIKASYKLWLYPTTNRISLLLHGSEAKPRMSVNNNDILQV